MKLRRWIRKGTRVDPDKVLMRLGRLSERWPRAWHYVSTEWKKGKLNWYWDRPALRLAHYRDGAYLLRTNLSDHSPQALWRMYVQLTEVEAVFRALKSELAIRPIWHWVGPRVEAHVMVAFLGYCLWVCLKQKLKATAPGLSPWQVLGPVQAHRAGGGVVQAEGGRSDLPAADHSTRTCPGDAVASNGLVAARTATAADLSGSAHGCVADLKPTILIFPKENVFPSPNLRKSG